MGSKVSGYLFLCLLVIMSCNKGEEAEPDLLEVCIEGWFPSNDNSSSFYQDCPDLAQSQYVCSKTFNIELNVTDYDGAQPAVLLIRSHNNDGLIADYERDVEMKSQSFQTVVGFNSDRFLAHEITLKLPTDDCTVNENLWSYTYRLGIACSGTGYFLFEIRCSR